jgi:hypothetical protein
VGVMGMRIVYSSLVGKCLEERYLEDYEHFSQKFWNCTLNML